MKMKKPIALALLVTVLLIESLTTVFATPPVIKKKAPASANTYISENSPADAPVQKSGTDAKGGEIHNTISYDMVTVKHYADGGAPYVFWQRTNNTEKSIAQIQFGMLAFDKNGKALNLPWTVFDSSAGYAYDVLCEWKPKNFAPNRQADSADGSGEGGWSLGWSIDLFEKDTPELRELFENVAYVLCFDKQVEFGDGSVWNNPDYENWLATYKGKEVDIATLQNYYPMEQKILP